MSVRYEATIALHPLTLEFPAGSFTVLLGPSGAGKSTLLQCMNHLVIPSTGFIEVAGIGRLDSSSRVRAHRRRTSMIFQQHQLIGVILGTVTIVDGLSGWLRSRFA
ncbi:ATP-binding cassette domain-containing protein [Mycobacterium sp. 1465703.0]|uniref:ATP-binding cassette domain-containing protein n=1 Tax=Mycobacterium sp. 1465703.0 TaxID=1834078 RepID=UPI001E285807|nr:ATP-binding cassette domain-containing protein [Mycobacterium sp. 1465703.0]